MRYSIWVKPILTILTAILLIADSVHSFRQHHQMCMDGDMTFNVLLSDDVKKILDDPLALGVLLHDEQYLNPNRYFAHLANHHYCWNAPIWLQSIVDPIESIYLSQAIFKIFLQLCLIFLLAYFISPNAKWYHAERLLPALLVTPFFQTFGFNIQMGIIDKSMTYDFFYALPIIFVGLYFMPVYLSFRNRKKMNALHFIWMIPCAFIVAFSGPLNLGIAPVISLMVLTGLSIQNIKANGGLKLRILLRDSVFWAAGIMVVICSYSLFINALAGTMAEDIPPLGERYLLLLKGIPSLFAEKIGLSWLIALILLNLLILRKDNLVHWRWTKVYAWVGAVIVIYMALLPLGGYRSYRPWIIRFDTFMPVTLLLVWLFGVSAFQIISGKVSGWKFAYYFAVIYSLVYFTQYDKLPDSAYDCERRMLHEIASSPEKIVKISEPCSVVDWQSITDFRMSEKQAELLLHWNVTREKKLFYYEPSASE